MEGAIEALRQLALRLPETEEGIACEGTAVEKRTIKVRKKAFLFLGAGDAMLKLRDSLPEAARLASKEPLRCKAGASGWVTVKARNDRVTPKSLLRKWVEESYGLFAPKKASPRRAAKPR